MSDVRERLEAEALRLRGRVIHLDRLVKRWAAIEAEALAALGEPEPAEPEPAAAPDPAETKRAKAREYQRAKRRREREQLAAARQAQETVQEPPGEPTSPEAATLGPAAAVGAPGASSGAPAEHPLLRVPEITSLGPKADVFTKAGSAPFLGRDWNGDAAAEPAPC